MFDFDFEKAYMIDTEQIEKHFSGTVSRLLGYNYLKDIIKQKKFIDLIKPVIIIDMSETERFHNEGFVKIMKFENVGFGKEMHIKSSVEFVDNVNSTCLFANKRKAIKACKNFVYKLLNKIENF